jgi:hypothetical protein
MVDPEGKKEIFGQWSEACRWAEYNGQECNVKLNSVRSVVEDLDSIAKKMLGGVK